MQLIQIKMLILTFLQFPIFTLCMLTNNQNYDRIHLFPAGLHAVFLACKYASKEDKMQIQKNINPYELYSNRVSSTKTRQETLSNRKTKHKNLYTFAAILTIVVFVFAITAINIAFDSSVMAMQPEFKMNTPEYSSSNAVFSGYVPTVNISVIDRGEDKIVLSTEVATVEKIFEENEIVLDESCVVNYPVNTTIYEGMEIVIDSITYEDVEVVSAIQYSVKTNEVSNIPKGTKQVVTKGQNGSMTSTYRKKYVNGKLDSEELVSETVTKEAVAEVSNLGVGGSFVGGDGVTYNYSYYIDVVATCYGSGNGFYVGKTTATGYPVDESVIAVDPKVIPYHTKCYVTSSYRDLGVRYARDTGGGIKGNKIDVYLDESLEGLLQFGRRNMRVYILE